MYKCSPGLSIHLKRGSIQNACKELNAQSSARSTLVGLGFLTLGEGENLEIKYTYTKCSVSVIVTYLWFPLLNRWLVQPKFSTELELCNAQVVFIPCSGPLLASPS